MQTHNTTLHEQISRWIQEKYPAHQKEGRALVFTSSACCNLTALSYIPDGFGLDEQIVYKSWDDYPCDMISPVQTYLDEMPTTRTGGMVYHFQDGNQPFDIIMISAWINDDDINSTMVSIASVPPRYLAAWKRFEKECQRIAGSAIPFRGKVYIVGGKETTFTAETEWDDICLPPGLKEDIRKDIDAFFSKGVDIYHRLNIKPFRKLLLAGVPGTGKTMLCSAIARWAKERNWFVVYVSASNRFGAIFWKIHEALEMAASSEAPTIVIVEELDAYMDDDSKAQVLNVLDGSESPENQYGTVMIATTNHPEEIDDRVMKRPGRLDRVFIIPELRTEDDAEAMLKRYLNDDWDDSFREILPDLIGKPGAFIREVVLYSLTQAAYDGAEGLPLETLRQSVKTLQDQIEAKEDFLTSHRERELGLLRGVKKSSRNGRNRGLFDDFDTFD